MTHVELKNAVREAIEEYRSDFWIDAEKHYNHHKLMEEYQAFKPEWQNNHRFVSDVRASGAVAKNVSFKILVTAVIGGLIAIFIKGWGT